MVFYVSDLFFDNEEVATRRHFSSASEMNNFIINNWNKVVCSTDTVYILGGIGNFDYISSLNGSKVLVMSENEREHFTEYVNSISSNRNEEYDYEMYESHLRSAYNIDKVCKSGSVLKKLYSGRVVRVATRYAPMKDATPIIVGSVNEYQRKFSGGINSNIFVNGYYPLSEVEIEDLLHKDKRLL